MFRADLGTDATTRTQDRVYFNSVLPDKKRGTCQVVDAISVSYTFFTDKKGLPAGFLQGFCKQYARFPRYNHRNPLESQGLLYGIDALFDPVRPDDGNMFYTDSLHDIFDRHLAVSIKIERLHINPRMGLMPGHGGDAVVENNQRKIMIVENSVNQTGNSGMKKCGVPDKRDDLFVCDF